MQLRKQSVSMGRASVDGIPIVYVHSDVEAGTVRKALAEVARVVLGLNDSAKERKRTECRHGNQKP